MGRVKLAKETLSRFVPTFILPMADSFDGFLSNLVQTHHVTNNTLESVFGFDVSSLSSTNVPVWKRWECNAENLPDFKINMKVTYSTELSLLSVEEQKNRGHGWYMQ